MKVPFVSFGLQYQAHKKEYDSAINRCLSKGNLILREDVEEFENNLAQFMNMKYAVGVNSGTDALLLALKAKGAKDTDIIIPGYTFKATAEAIKHSGNNAWFEDIGSNRMFKGAKTRNWEYNLPVHIEGMVCKVKRAIIEDAAQAIGAKGVGYSGTACFSFYPAKILGGFGDGGAVVTNHKYVADKVRLYRHHWQTNRNERYGYTSRLDNVQAAFLNVKLKYLPEILKRREEIAKQYLKELEGLVGLPIDQEGRVWQDFVIRVKEPLHLATVLHKAGIETLGVNMTPPHKALATGQELPETEKLYKEMIRLPLNETLNEKQVRHVIKSVQRFYDK